MEIDTCDILRMQQENMEQRDGHEALLCMVQAKHLLVVLVDDRLTAETRRGDEHQRQLEEIQQFLRRTGISSSPGSVDSALQ